MKFLPYDNLVFHSPLSENEIRNRLNCLTRASNSFRKKYYPQIKVNDYDGDVWNSRFDISRLISYRNSFLPQIRGTISTEASGTKISIKMRLHLVAIIVGCIWFGGLFAAVAGLLLTRSASLTGMPIPLVMILFGYLLFTIPFAIEASIAKKDLSRLFECQPEQNRNT